MSVWVVESWADHGYDHWIDGVYATESLARASATAKQDYFEARVVADDEAPKTWARRWWQVNEFQVQEATDDPQT